jgi:hypothetical protein
MLRSRNEADPTFSNCAPRQALGTQRLERRVVRLSYEIGPTPDWLLKYGIDYSLQKYAGHARSGRNGH